MLKYHIQTIEVGSGGAANITFNSIPDDFDDLYLVTSLRAASATVATGVFFRFNGSTSNYTSRRMYSIVTNAPTSDTNVAQFIATGANATANTFSNISTYIHNYRSNVNKYVSFNGVGETNDSYRMLGMAGMMWAVADPVTSILIADENGGNFAQYSSASLYGIKRGSSGEVEVASGGAVSYSGGYTIHTFQSSGTFVANRDLDVEYLVVGGGGGGEGDPNFSASASGGGAGGYRCSVQGELSGGSSSPESLFRVSSGASYLVTVGGGGAGGTASVNPGNRGTQSSFSSIVSFGGGGGDNYVSPELNGSGGGAGNTNKVGITGTVGQGTDGGPSINPSETYQTGGGGGAGAAGSTPNGGAGLTSNITGTAVARGGGGGGAVFSGTQGVGGIGGGGNAVSGAGSAFTGGGGGGGRLGTSGGQGGSGVVIIRYPTPA